MFRHFLLLCSFSMTFILFSSLVQAADEDNFEYTDQNIASQTEVTASEITDQNVAEPVKATAGDSLQIFDLPQADDPLYEQKMEIRHEDAFLNDLLKTDKKNNTWVQTLNAALAEYKSKVAGGTPDGEAFNEYFLVRSNVCTGCIREMMGKDYVESELTAESSETCRNILESEEFLDRKDQIIFESPEGIVYDFSTFYSGSGSAPDPYLKVRKTEEPLEKATQRSVYYPIWWMNTIGYFKLDQKLFFTNSDFDAKRFSIFEFVPEHFYFKDVCTISSDTSELIITVGEDEPICQDIAQKTYRAYNENPISNVLPDNLYQGYHQAMCAVSANMENDADEEKIKACIENKKVDAYLLAADSWGGEMGVLADYNNDGKNEYLVKTDYDSPAGTGCRHSYLRVYNPTVLNTQLITTGRIEDVYSNGVASNDGYSISCFDGKQSIISNKNVNYLLTSNVDGPERLDLIKTLEDGKNEVELLCSFKTQHIYK